MEVACHRQDGNSSLCDGGVAVSLAVGRVPRLGGGGEAATGGELPPPV
jgi:hypothetical protein